MSFMSPFPPGIIGILLLWKIQYFFNSSLRDPDLKKNLFKTYEDDKIHKLSRILCDQLISLSPKFLNCNVYLIKFKYYTPSLSKIS